MQQQKHKMLCPRCQRRLGRHVAVRVERELGSQPSLREILDAVCEDFEIDAEAVRRGGRNRELATVRACVCFLARELTLATFVEIGRLLNRHHTSALAGQRRIARQLAREKTLAGRLRRIRFALGYAEEAASCER
jgi:chromosomal replication initiation ATPase DnaA